MKNTYEKFFKSKIRSALILFSAFLTFSLSDMLFAQDFWQPSNGPSGGFVTDVQVNPVNGDLYALVGASPDVLYLSTDAGATWQRLPELPALSTAIAISNLGHLFLAAKDNNGIYRSTNGGQSWDAMPTGGTGEITALCFDSGSGYLYAGTYKEGIYRSADEGKNWQASIVGFTNYENLRVRRIFISNNGFLYFTAWERSQEGGVYYSTNNGASCTRILSSTETEADISDVVVDTRGDIYVTTKYAKIFITRDDGASWTADTLSTSQPS